MGVVRWVTICRQKCTLMMVAVYWLHWMWLSGRPLSVCLWPTLVPQPSSIASIILSIFQTFPSPTAKILSACSRLGLFALSTGSMASEKLMFLPVLLFAACVAAADAGNDFSNNLFSDLAPLLALFGERVTMQFMSQSMGWADNIILAMAPLGIITAIIAAIRVGGPSWLKAVIGRARENLAAAEAELMSSTSKETCELWNGQEVVRCTGAAPVVEFICLLPESRQQGSQNGEGSHANVKTCDLDTATKGECQHLEEIDLNFKDDFHRWRTSPKKDEERAPADDTRQEGALADGAQQEVVIIRNKSAAAPNISLNSHNQSGRGELRAVAVVATILQLGVLTYSGFATYHPTLTFQKDGKPIDGYAFPCTAIGTMLLVAGMLACGHVVESSTQEKRYRAREGHRARLIWLQQTKTVSDQIFDSFAIYAKDDRTVITTSSRAGGQHESTNSADSPNPDASSPQTQKRSDTTSKRDHTTILAFKTVLSTVVTLCGFLVQFIGLRGMHWSASVAQLGAVLVMTGLRSWVRRGLAEPPACKRLTPGHELEWFAMTLGDLDKAPWLATSNGAASTSEKAVGVWRIVTSGNQMYEKLVTAKPNSGDSKAHAVMEIRRDLGELAGWPGPASAEAIALARAIEVTMDALFGNSLTNDFFWVLPARYIQSDAQPNAQPDAQSIYFRLRRDNGTWKAYADEIDAALSLWLYSVSEHEQGEQGKQASPGSRHPKSDSWLRAKGSPAKPSLRLLGLYTPGLHRDLWWWMPRDTARIIQVEQKAERDDSGMLEVENHRIVGFGSGAGIASQKPGGQTRYTSWDLATFNLHLTGGSVGGKETLLATESYDALKLLYAQDMFSAFMWAAAKTLVAPLDGGVNIRPDDTSSSNAWQSFTLQNDRLSRMAQDVQSTGLGSLDQIYLSIIPPLGEQQRLPQTTAIVELARRQAEKHEQLQHWKQASDAYLWLFQVAQTYPGQSGIATKATAVLMEYLRTITQALELREAQYDQGDARELKKLKSELENKLRTVDRQILSGLMSLYEQQARYWICVPVQEARSGLVNEICYPWTFEFTPLHDAAGSDDMPETTGLFSRGRRSYLNAKDIHGWTPLHYAVAKGSEYITPMLLERQADVNAQDLSGWTPLHYACKAGKPAMVRKLLGERAEPSVRGKDGMTPLHCAVTNGHLDVVRQLIEAGAALDVPDASGATPFLWAVYLGHRDVAEYLWQDANKKTRDYHGRTALHLAVIAGRVEMVQMLEGTERKAKDRDGRTPLHLAAVSGHETVASLLVEAGADKEAGDGWGHTPLHLASQNGHEAVADLLVKAGANKEVGNNWRLTPLHLAAERGHEAIIRLLLKAGANKQRESTYRSTPLHLAAKNGHEAVAKLLLDAGAKKEAETILGVTPLHLAERGNHAAVIRLLKEGL
ncbi:hypothetical protein MAPG_04247 [Magnaporthiopsis poae ATCC 64411]|uniref:Uncharacterized protein n=1 Tax=Magnaporthiopsis poae (strain ATCC 64411 / 73-15) TaxID=644358 RepID=A0A0C4DW73_MAGP6|nr:hypothetical protein MAPG_04247 [Magnaporthiopsis poae ATCC 64411]